MYRIQIKGNTLTVEVDLSEELEEVLRSEIVPKMIAMRNLMRPKNEIRQRDHRPNNGTN